MPSGDLLIWLCIGGTGGALLGCFAAAIWNSFATQPEPQTSELVVDEDEPDPVLTFRRIGPIADAVVADLDRRRRWSRVFAPVEIARRLFSNIN